MQQGELLTNEQAPPSDSKRGERHTRISVTRYSADEVIRQFIGLYACLDFTAQLEYIGVRRMQFLRRKKVLREFRAMSIALWGLALQKSFPGNAGNFFSEFLEKAAFLLGNGREATRLRERVNDYVTLLASKKDADFSPVADYLAKILALHSDDVARLRLKLSLIIRNLYVLIFDNLV